MKKENTLSFPSPPAHLEDLVPSGQSIARVVTVDRGTYTVRHAHGELSSSVSGSFRHSTSDNSDFPCVGDWVSIELASSELAIIHSVLPRTSWLRRKAPGKTVGFQMIAANIDVAFIMQSCQADFNLKRLDRYLVMVHEGKIEPIVILSKTDLLPSDEVDGMMLDMRGAGVTATIIPLSNETGQGLERFQSMLEPEKTYCFIGSSGVGKSTLINTVMGREIQATRSVSETGEGTHTTTRRQLIFLDNGTTFIDTPGMRELGLLGSSESVHDVFDDIQQLALQCRFANCGHTEEPDCAIRIAMHKGDLDENRFESYLKLKKETDYNDLSYIEKRKKDKDFGRMIKSVKALKSVKKR